MSEDKAQAQGPGELPFIGKVLFVVLFTAFMAAFSYFVLPYVYEYVSLPFGDWVYEHARQWTGEPPRPPRT